MDEQDYSNQNNKKEDIIDKSENENYPSENELISSQTNNSENSSQENYCPPPISLEVSEKSKDQQNPEPQAPYLKYGAIYNPNYLGPPSNPVENDVPNQPENYNQNAVNIQVEEKIDYQPPIIQMQREPATVKENNERKRNEQQRQRNEEDCSACCVEVCGAICEACCLALIQGLCEGLSG